MAPGANLGALMIGFLVAIIGSCMGYLEAWAINPGPRFRSKTLLLLSQVGAQLRTSRHPTTTGGSRLRSPL